jgi:uncharacterized protein (TIGR03437 family)
MRPDVTPYLLTIPAMFLLTALLSGSAVCAEKRNSSQTLYYTSASIVSAASNVASELSPNSFATVYGVGMAYTTRAITSDDIQANTLPTILPGTGVRVWVGGVAAQLYFVSPTQINFLVPCNLKAGEVDVYVTLDGSYGPVVRVRLQDAAPALFEWDQRMATATHADNSAITPEHPASPGEVVVLYLTGLGPTTPAAVYGQLPTEATWITRLDELQVLVGGVPLASTEIWYAGVAPGFAGLYQINFRLPQTVAANPPLQVAIGSQISSSGVWLPLKVN